MDAFVVRVTPSLASQIVPHTCVLSYDHTGFHTRWTHRPTTRTTEHASVGWRIRGRTGKPVQLRMVADASVDAMLAAVNTPPTVQPLSQQNSERQLPFVPFLKSHLQKTVRQQQHALAVATTKALLERDVLQCVRRVAIVMVEDVDLHPTAFGVLTWWTAVLSRWAARRKKARMPDVLVAADVPDALCEWLLGLVHALCAHPVHRPFPYDSATVDTYPSPWAHLKSLHAFTSPNKPTQLVAAGTSPTLPSYLVLRVLGDYCLPEWVPRGVCAAVDAQRAKRLTHVRDAVQSVMLRATYGGLHGDIRLLHSVATSYTRAMHRTHLPQHVAAPPTPIRRIAYDSVSRLHVDDWNVDAIDYHVAAYMLTDVVAPLVYDTAIDLQRMVWENMSSVNTRDKRTPRYAEDVWLRHVHRHVHRWQKSVLRKRFARLGRQWV